MAVVQTLLAPFRACLGFFIMLVGLFIYAVGILCIPLIYLGFAVSCRLHRIHTVLGEHEAEQLVNYKPIEFPKDSPKYRVAVVGAGWVGTQAAKCLKDRGVEVMLFEQLSDIGGTWNKEFAYVGQKLHSPGWSAEFQGFPMTDEQRRRRVTAEELREYHQKYFEEYKMRDYTKFNAKLLSVDYNSKTGKSSITVQNTAGEGAHSTFDDFDLVVYASFTHKTNVPKWPGREEYKGEVIHCRYVKADVIQKWKDENKKVVVIGGNKSATDMLVQLVHEYKFPMENVTWLSRSNYHFMTYEALAHNRSIWGMVQNFAAIFAVNLCIISPFFSCMMLRLIRSTMQPVGRWHFDQKKFHKGALSRQEVELLQSVPCVEDEIARFTPSGYILKRENSGKEYQADVIICATGFGMAIGDIDVQVDGQSVIVNNPKEHRQTPLFEGIFHTECIRLAFAGYNIYEFGMKRGVSVADHCVSFLIRQPSKEQMAAAAQKTHKVDGVDHYFFKSQSNLLTFWMWDYIDLIKSGLITRKSVFNHFSGFFMFNYQVPLQFIQPDPKQIATSKQLEPKAT